MLSDYVSIEHNYSTYEPDELIHVCARKNNNKRSFLFVNKLQGKHFPVNPRKSFEMFDELYDRIPWYNGRTLIIGFAETATAIGARIAQKAIEDNRDIYYIQTTRESIDKDYVVFSESHSHATEQRLYIGNVKYDNILFVEDEITTGKTILSAVKYLAPAKHIVVASICNWQTEADQGKWLESKIERSYLFSGKLLNKIYQFAAADDGVVEVATHCKLPVLPNAVFSDSPNPRTGLTADEFMNWIKPYANANSLAYFYHQNRIQDMGKAGLPVSIIGTEENMFLPMLAIVSAGEDYTFHATTRSPITVSKDPNYLLNSRIKLPSVYDIGRTTYLYNYQNYHNYLFLEEGFRFERASA